MFKYIKKGIIKDMKRTQYILVLHTFLCFIYIYWLVTIIKMFVQLMQHFDFVEIP